LYFEAALLRGGARPLFFCAKNLPKLCLSAGGLKLNFPVDYDHRQQKYKHYQGEPQQPYVGCPVRGFKLAFQLPDLGFYLSSVHD